jgi:hypothetical protein
MANMTTHPLHVSEFDRLLRQAPQSQLRLALPDGSLVPAHFHVTEVGRVEKRFIDCGGTRRETVACVLQVWVAEDRDHRLSAGKLAGILELARDLLAGQDPRVEVEYERGVVSQYPIIASESQEGLLLFHLGLKHTDCLAKDRCGIPVSADGATGCCGPGCC